MADSKLDENISEQASFIKQMLDDNEHGPNVIKGKSANELEHLLKSLMPIVRISDTKFLFGSSVKNVQIHSEKLHVMVGGGAVPLNQHWRASVVSETIKLNKLINQSKKKVSAVVKQVLEQAGVNA